ncbi:MAG: hypothetical protein ACRC2T_08360 [Thermoguttaceae bacterium]
MNRRDWMSLAGGTAAMVVAGQATEGFAQQSTGTGRRGTGAGRAGRTLTKYPNEHFYKDGKFDEKAARDAYAEMFRFHRYSLADKILNSKDFWVLEFGLGDFSNVGMAGIFFVNDKEHGYFGHEIYLLPGQMIAEHYHMPGEGLPAKHECWQVRHGDIWTLSQGGSIADWPKELTFPKSQDGSITCFEGKNLKVGDMEYLRKLEEPHFMMAGPQGAIVTEYASYHSGEGLRFTNPKAKL